MLHCTTPCKNKIVLVDCVQCLPRIFSRGFLWGKDGCTASGPVVSHPGEGDKVQTSGAPNLPGLNTRCDVYKKQSVVIGHIFNDCRVRDSLAAHITERQLNKFFYVSPRSLLGCIGTLTVTQQRNGVPPSQRAIYYPLSVHSFYSSTLCTLASTSGLVMLMGSDY